jgi:hypothetical protein
MPEIACDDACATVSSFEVVAEHLDRAPARRARRASAARPRPSARRVRGDQLAHARRAAPPRTRRERLGLQPHGQARGVLALDLARQRVLLDADGQRRQCDAGSARTLRSSSAEHASVRLERAADREADVDRELALADLGQELDAQRLRALVREPPEPASARAARPTAPRARPQQPGIDARTRVHALVEQPAERPAVQPEDSAEREHVPRRTRERRHQPNATSSEPPRREQPRERPRFATERREEAPRASKLVAVAFAPSNRRPRNSLIRAARAAPERQPRARREHRDEQHRDQERREQRATTVSAWSPKIWPAMPCTNTIGANTATVVSVEA